MKHRYRWILSTSSLILALGAVASAEAGSLEVTVHDRAGEPVERETVVLLTLSSAGLRPYRPGVALPQSTTDQQGLARFSGLAPGTYIVTLPHLWHDELLRPFYNPLAPPPRVSLFEDSEELRVDVELWRGIRTTVSIDVPYDEVKGFAAVLRHRETGRSLTIPFRDAPFVEQLLVPGVWDVSVTPRPGYLLVGVEHERLPVPGSSVRLDLAQDPRETFLHFTYTAPAALTGTVVDETGGTPGVTVEATLVEPGTWIDAARQRGGSVYDKVIAAVDDRTGRYETVLPDGRWQVRPIGSSLVGSDPEMVELDLAPGETGQADFTVRMEDGGGHDQLLVIVRDREGAYVGRAAVEVYAAGDSSERLRAGTTPHSGRVVLPGLEDGSYRVLAGHPDYLEGSVLLPDLGTQRGLPSAEVILDPGAEIRLRASDAADRPLPEAEVSFERLGDPPELTLQDPDFREAKIRRTLTTDQSGRAARQGFYPGTYRARARLRGRDGTRGLIYLSAGEGKLEREIELEIGGSERIDIAARMLPASSWTLSLVCADPPWVLPDAADVRVYDAMTTLSGLDLDEAGTGSGQVLALEAAVLGGRHRDMLAVGPVKSGIYRLAVRPVGFDRWTWAFETTDPLAASEIQAAPGEGGEPSSLGDFEVECGPALDLLPEVADGTPFPDLDKVGVTPRILDRDGEREIASPPIVNRRRGRLELRGLPRGPMRLDVVLRHPYFLPTATRSLQVELELERGQYREIVVQIEAVGGAVEVDGPGSKARLYGPGEQVREASLSDRKAEIPSLVPGLYRLEVVDDSGTVIRAWEDLEVRAGETRRLRIEP